ncbi:hypothetical protein Scep_003716 [Stephania cephalantha]|uniref:Uncharacterized protein n=1 Tax=Stephania cephalantha TaxID=152367 RepID=A0AAP0KSZ8_9MAGN
MVMKWLCFTELSQQTCFFVEIQQQQQQQHSLSPKLIGVDYMNQTFSFCSIKCN